MFKKSLTASLVALALAATASAQGPVILMGIDAEDGGPGVHGPISAYSSVVTAGIAPNVANGGAGILVVGGGKSTFDNVTQFWDALGTSTGLPITYVNGPADIQSQSFAGFGIIGIASSFLDTPSGGLTAAEGDAINARAADIGNHVNGGGGLLGFSQGGITQPYGYLGALGSVSVNTGLGYSDITATPAGEAIGITDTNLDVCCWHDEYLSFPGFLDVLATNASTGNAAAIGGFDVVIVEGIVLTPFFASNPVGMTHTVTANVADSLGNPIPGATVDFEVISGPQVGQTGSVVTDAAGEATFTYAGSAVGTDQIEACFVDSTGLVVCSNIVEAEWVNSMCTNVDFEVSNSAGMPLFDGQEIDPFGEFGEFFTITGLSASGHSAAIFDSDPLGPNAMSSDDDLLVDRGHVLMLQENGAQSSPGFYDVPDDDMFGGVLDIDFLAPSTVCSVDLIDIDLDFFLDQSAQVTLTDSAGLTRTYSVPEGWTEDIAIDGGTGFRTLDLSTLMPQMGFASTATATEDAGFDGDQVVQLRVAMAGSGAIDNLAFIQPVPAAVSKKPTRDRKKR